MFVKKPWDIEEIIDRRRASGGYKNYKDFDGVERLGVTRRCNHTGIRRKSKSESDIQRGLGGNRFRENDGDDSASPSDSDVTIIRVRRRSLAQNIILAKFNCKGILGDGSHVADSPSMVNLATMIQRYGASSKINKKDERLVSLSSWDGNEIPISTVSDTGIFVSRSITERETRRASLLLLSSFAAWKRYCLANKDRRTKNERFVMTTVGHVAEAGGSSRSGVLIETRAEINNEQILESVLCQHGLSNAIMDYSCASRTLEIDNTRPNGNNEISPVREDCTEKNIPGTKKTRSRFSKRMEKAFRRFVGCSWVSGNPKKRADLVED